MNWVAKKTSFLVLQLLGALFFVHKVGKIITYSSKELIYVGTKKDTNSKTDTNVCPRFVQCPRFGGRWRCTSNPEPTGANIFSSQFSKCCANTCRTAGLWVCSWVGALCPATGTVPLAGHPQVLLSRGPTGRGTVPASLTRRPAPGSLVLVADAPAPGLSPSGSSGRVESSCAVSKQAPEVCLGDPVSVPGGGRSQVRLQRTARRTPGCPGRGTRMAPRVAPAAAPLRAAGRSWRRQVSSARPRAPCRQARSAPRRPPCRRAR
ncbi:PREDICTED: uncharacterized protein LOC106149910, partial [Chinchilla lanigera]|uniref:uncharacterized protein LOC106149910 n=1 Tax=Chinchilla lanigera TaxID=34839 RepID=UPI0006965392